MDQEGETEGMRTMETCSMAPMCKGMAERPRFGFPLVIPGLLLVLGGVLIGKAAHLMTARREVRWDSFSQPLLADS